eukprot:GHRR01027917.1.p1 GENE.GHRR01027917.1~~GHRR01027917.1.p1  ORF type:complete len:360 (+),score=132.20 GHRR01027917.1:204-1283(+)
MQYAYRTSNPIVLRREPLIPWWLIVLATLAIDTMAAATSTGPTAVGAPLQHAVAAVEPGLASVLLSIADSVTDISLGLRTMDLGQAGSTNSFGDDQLLADIHADDTIFRHLQQCPAVASASSEEKSDIQHLGGQGYTVAFDPLDGSSIFGANFAVGSIFGIWPGSTPLGQTGRDQAAAAYAVYGPRTLLVLAVPTGSGSAASTCSRHQPQQQQQQQPSEQQQQQSPSEAFDVLEFVLTDSHKWQLRQVYTKIGSKNNIAPANLRAAADNQTYKHLLDRWITSGAKLRYSGGMVPDVHHILAKVGVCSHQRRPVERSSAVLACSIRLTQGSKPCSLQLRYAVLITTLFQVHRDSIRVCRQ